MASKKGFFITLSLSFFVLMILSLSILFLKQANLSESLNTNLIFLQKTDDLDSSIKSVFSEAYLNEAGINYYQNNNHSFTIVSNLSKSFTALDSLLAQLQTDLEADFPMIKIYFNNFLTTHGIISNVGEIPYYFNSTNGVYISNRSIINYYNISLKLNSGLTSCTNNLLAGGAVSINVSIISNTNNCSYMGGLSQGTVDLIDSDLNGIQIRLNSLGALNISISKPSAGANYLITNITIDYDAVNQKNYFYLPMEVEVFDALFDFNKRSNVYLPLND